MNFLFKNNETLPLSMGYQGKIDQEQDHDNKMYAEYDALQMNRPDYEEFFGRPVDYPKYTDQYDTGTGFSLRELLLLCWWGHSKSGRPVNSTIPLYFYQQYHLNVAKATKRFIDKGWLIKNKDRYQLFDEAKKNVKKYDILWKMHLENQFSFCLDEDFPK